jgi:hypothetical protein
LGAHAPEWALAAGSAPDAEFTLIELQLDAKGGRRQDVAQRERRDRCRGQHAGARRLRRGAAACSGSPDDANRTFCLCAAARWSPPLRAAATSEVADAASRGDREAVRAAIARRADVNLPQVDGTTALHWAVERGRLEMATCCSAPARA